MQSIFTNLNGLNKKLLTEIIKNGDTVIDATLGNGWDAVYLAKLVGPEGKVFGFDIQEEAVTRSSERMKKEGISNYNFLVESHSEMDSYVKEASAIVFNLGYLPGGSKEIRTDSITTLEAIKKALKILKSPGIIGIMFYTGHPGGKEEKDIVIPFLEDLNKRKYDVLKVEHINGKDTAPFLILIYKKGE